MGSLIRKAGGFTLIELVMVILLIAILAAVALPNFFDFRTDAKNAATYGALAGLRSAVAIAKASISLKENPATAPSYPSIFEMQSNTFDPSIHPVLAVLPSNHIMDQASGTPQNPWTLTTVPLFQRNTIWDCSSLSRGMILSVAGQQNIGWCYNTATGEIWANSAQNGGSLFYTENYY